MQLFPSNKVSTDGITTTLSSTHALDSRFRFLGVFCLAGLPFVDVDMASNVDLGTGRMLDVRVES